MPFLSSCLLFFPSVGLGNVRTLTGPDPVSVALPSVETFLRTAGWREALVANMATSLYLALSDYQTLRVYPSWSLERFWIPWIYQGR